VVKQEDAVRADTAMFVEKTGAVKTKPETSTKSAAKVALMDTEFMAVTEFTVENTAGTDTMGTADVASMAIIITDGMDIITVSTIMAVGHIRTLSCMMPSGLT
jgi:hypothetical protein